MLDYLRRNWREISRYSRAHYHKFKNFSKVGACTSATGLALNFIFLKFIGTPLYATYTTVYASMIALSLYLNSSFVFRRRISHRRRIVYFLIYINSYLVAMVCLKTCKVLFSFENWVYPFMILPITVSLNYILTSTLFAQATETSAERQMNTQCDIERPQL